MAIQPTHIKIALIGSSKSGKSALVNRLTKGTFEETMLFPTIGAQFAQHNVEINDTRVTMQIWDTAGQERFHSLTQLYFKNSNAVVIVYDLNDEKSFKDVESHWKKEVEENMNLEPDEYSIWLLANKCDLMEVNFASNLFAAKFPRGSYDIRTGVELLVSGYCKSMSHINMSIPSDIIHICHEYCGDISEGQIYALENGLNFACCSAKNDINVKETFYQIAVKACEQHQQDSTLNLAPVVHPMNNVGMCTCA